MKRDNLEKLKKIRNCLMYSYNNSCQHIVFISKLLLQENIKEIARILEEETNDNLEKIHMILNTAYKNTKFYCVVGFGRKELETIIDALNFEISIEENRKKL